MDTYRFRSGVEAIISLFILMTRTTITLSGFKKNIIYSQKLKTLAINIFRIAGYLQSIGVSTKLSKFLAYCFAFSGLRKQIIIPDILPLLVCIFVENNPTNKQSYLR